MAKSHEAILKRLCIHYNDKHNYILQCPFLKISVFILLLSALHDLKVTIIEILVCSHIMGANLNIHLCYIKPLELHTLFLWCCADQLYYKVRYNALWLTNQFYELRKKKVENDKFCLSL